MSETNSFSNKLIAASMLVTSGLYLGNGSDLPEKLGGLKAEAASTVYYETTANLHMRSKSSMNSKISMTIPKGKQVIYISKTGDWYKVQYGTRTGYVSSRYLKKVTKVYTTTANLNLRTKASTSSAIVTTIPKGKTVTYVSKSGSWYKVKYGSKSGYVSSKYIKASSSSSNTSSQTAIKATKFKTTANLYLRSKASTSSSSYLLIPKGKVVTATAKSGNWYKVSYGGKTGWVSGTYLKAYNTTTATSLTYYATTGTSKLYKSASTSSTVVYSIKSGNVFKSTQKVVTSTGATWYRVLYNNSYYYIQSTQVKKMTEKSIPAATYKADTATSLYSFAGTAYSKLTSIPKGATVKAVSTIGDWYKVTYGSKTGYVNIKQFSKQTSAGTSIAATKYKTTANLNLRSSASMSGNILTMIPKGKTVTATAKSGSWYKVNYNGLTGWVSGSYLMKDTTNSTGTSTDGEVSQSYVTTANLNIRKTASTASSKLGFIPKGTTIKATKYNSSWYKVTYGGVSGYVSASYLVSSSSSSAEQTSTSYLMMDLRTESSVTAAQINQYIAKYTTSSNSVLYGKGSAFISAGKKYGVNALYLAAHAIHESNYGKSTIAKAKNNLFGFGAYDSSPFVSAVKFSSVESCINYLAQEMKATYLNPSSWKYKGAYLGYTVKGADGKRIDSLSTGMNFYYASDSNWGRSIAKHMENILPFSKEGAKNRTPNKTYPAYPSFPSGSDTFPSGTLAIAKTSIKLYSTKGSSSVAATITSGKSFYLDAKYNDYWFRVTYNGKTYYTNKISMSSYSSYMSVKNLARVSASSLNVRSTPSTSGSVIGKLSNYQYVHLVLNSSNVPVTSNGWYKVKLSNGTVGWCQGSYLLRLLNG